MFNLIIKDFKNIFYDLKSLMFILVMPIALMSILGMALQGVFSNTMSSEVFNVQIGVVKDYDYDQEMDKVLGQFESGFFAEAEIDEETLADMNPERIFFDEFLEVEEIQEILSYEILTEEEAINQLDSGEIDAYVVLPKNYVYNGILNFISPADMRNITNIEIIKSSDTENDFNVNMVEMILSSYFRNMENRIAMSKVAMNVAITNQLGTESMTAMIEQMAQTEIDAIEIPAESIPGSVSITSFQYYAVAIMAMFIMYSAATGARALFQETKEYTFQRLEVSGTTVNKMLLSNFFRIMMIVLTQSVLMMLYTMVVLKVPWGNMTNQILVLLLSSFAVAAVGTFIAVISLQFNNVKLANVFEFAVVQMMALLGGSFLPVEILPEGFQKLSFLSLNASVLGGYLNGMYERPLSDMSSDIIYMVAFGLIFIIASGIVGRLKRRESVA